MQFTAVITALAMFASLGAASSQDMCRSAPIRYVFSFFPPILIISLTEYGNIHKSNGTDQKHSLEACEGQLKRSVGMTSLPRHFLDSIKKARGVQINADVVVEKK